MNGNGHGRWMVFPVTKEYGDLEVVDEERRLNRRDRVKKERRALRKRLFLTGRTVCRMTCDPEIMVAAERGLLDPDELRASLFIEAAR